ncbi:S-layer homology domain-containing protein [Paenibacillus sp. YYML68]|uniref:S-layer homology domain-containing protein n=1 Tax=Paenibacillus sp. YYML68 TaxID=2909250 RepID=UPI002490509B|nr:S-layer homology domain-containing protein [Paenibacillus sp. YYML68]
MGEEILRIFDDTINDYVTLTVPISANRLKLGDNVISIRAGSKASPFDTRTEENKDDFDVRNVRLVLADGTEIRDSRYSDKETVLKMGDSAGKHPVIDFEFALGAEHLASKAYAWDTRQLVDGLHEVKVAHLNDGEKKATITVDNTPPVIQLELTDGQTYKGPFTIQADVTDVHAGVDKVEAWIDSEPIVMPYETSSAKLSAGDHTVKVRAVDKIGNVSEQAVTIQIEPEHPNAPELVAPQSGVEGTLTNAQLTVRVSDPTNDAMNVSFFRGYKYTAASGASFDAYQHAADVEPPKQRVLPGEHRLNDEQRELIAERDGRYMTNDSMTQFPYQRFEVMVDDSVQPTDLVEMNWSGRSLEGRKVTLYAWNEQQGEWSKLDTKVAASDDFELKASVKAGDYMLQQTIYVLVQDEIPPTPADYDYSFVWMSDTQYYSESYPHIYQSIVKWIAEKKDEMKIKYVVHTGDLVDEADKAYQWAEASKNMKVLEDASIPYGVLAGNHDVAGKSGAYDYYWQHFGEERFKRQETFGGSYDNNRGHYDLISSHGNDYIFVYMGWGIGDAEIAWMNEVLQQHPDRMAVLSFHEYLLVSGNRAPIADKIFEQVVVPNKNVVAALSGHYHDAELLVDQIDDDGDGTPDRNVYQMLADYQGGPEGGQGYIRLMQFDIDNNKLHMKTYSPYLDDYNYYDPAQYPGKDEFSLDLSLQPKLKRVSTDYLELKVYTDQQIGTVQQADSGTEARTNWFGLVKNKLHQWYAVAEDLFGGRTVSDIWSFVTGDRDDETGSGGGSSGGGQPGSGGGGSGGGQPDPGPDGGSSGGNSGQPQKITSITLTGQSELYIGEQDVTVTSVVYSGGSRQVTEGVTYSITNTAVATINTLGQLTAVGAGTTIVKASYGSFTAEYTLVVRPRLESIELSGIPSLLMSGDVRASVLYGHYSDSTKAAMTAGAVYSSSSPQVATIDAAGVVRALASGQTVITATYASLISTVKLTVEEPSSSDSAPASGQAPPADLSNQEAVEVTTEQLKELVTEAGIVVQLQADKKELVLPGLVSTLAGEKPIVVQAQQVSLAVPSEVLKTLSRLVPAEQLADSRIVLKAEPVQAAEADKLLAAAGQQAGAAVTAAGEVYEFKLEIMTKDGKSSELSRFEQPIELTLAASTSADKRLAGIYYVADDGKLEYIGGTWSDGKLTAPITHFSKYAVLEYRKSFSDVPSSHWASSTVTELAAKHLIDGVSANEFAPNAEVTRAEFTAMLVRLLGLKAKTTDSRFSDVGRADWYADAVAAAVEAGIVEGTSEHMFSPQAPIKRQEMAVMLLRAYKLSPSASAAAPQLKSTFGDMSDAPQWAKQSVEEAYSLQLVQGRAAELFAPLGHMTRAESAQAILNVLMKL